ncbi:alkaline phosphatase D family protein [Herbihabitans rhizosphaerae]|nr:alkaline phosphatase D family protein [Herbihabitans rhizosphaerae]
MSEKIRRRTVLGGAAAVAGVATVGAVAFASPRSAEVFQHGVASGDPLPDGVLLWTRVTPSADATPGSGVGSTVDVRWEVATDATFGTVVASGLIRTGPERDHTVKVDVGGLTAGTAYAYRFTLDGAVSPVGLTRTAPTATARLRFGLVSCSNWQAGHFAAYRYLAERGDLDAVIHAGDYLYEYGSKQYPDGQDVRPHDPAHEIITLADYRRRHAQYKTDPHLSRLHALCPWIVTWDDHEFANDAWAGGAQNHTDPEGPWAVRKANALQAYFEWMPVRNDGDKIYRRLRFGDLAELSMLDLRQYRSLQVSNTDGGAIDDPNRTIAGREQLDWLIDGIVSSGARWKLVGTSVMATPVALPPLSPELAGALAKLLGLPSEGIPVNPDQWDGYAADRRRMLKALADNKVRNTVFLTGDIHSSWACDVPIDAGTYPLSKSVAVEFVATSVTSDNMDEILKVPPRTLTLAVEGGLTALNRHVKWLEFDSHGACVLEVTPSAAQVDWFFLADKTKPDSTLRHARSYRVQDGTQRVERVYSPIG